MVPPRARTWGILTSGSTARSSLRDRHLRKFFHGGDWSLVELDGRNDEVQLIWLKDLAGS